MLLEINSSLLQSLPRRFAGTIFEVDRAAAADNEGRAQ
jgi:hypothetical protein